MSPTEDIFLNRRSLFENDFLSTYSGTRGVHVDGKYLPRWFHTLYYTLRYHVMACYLRYTRGLRFLFQGFCFKWVLREFECELKRKVMKLGVPFCQVLVEMRCLAVVAREKRSLTLRKISAAHKAQKRTVLLDGFESFVSKCTSLALLTFVKSSWNLKGNYEVLEHQVVNIPAPYTQKTTAMCITVQNVKDLHIDCSTYIFFRTHR